MCTGHKEENIVERLPVFYRAQTHIHTYWKCVAFISASSHVFGLRRPQISPHSHEDTNRSQMIRCDLIPWWLLWGQQVFELQKKNDAVKWQKLTKVKLKKRQTWTQNKRLFLNISDKRLCRVINPCPICKK